MGKIIKDGFTFVAYANAGLIRKIDDIPELKGALIALGERKSHSQMVAYARLLGEHILNLGGMERSELVQECFSVLTRWQRKEARFQEALETAGRFNDLARAEANPVKAKALRAMGQIAATPHVRWHPLVASEYAVVMVNLLYPMDIEKVRSERALQITLMVSV